MTGHAYVFGYDSVMSSASMQRTLKAREVAPWRDLVPVTVTGWSREWRYATHVRFDDNPDDLVSMVFLDLTRASNQVCNGVVCRVTSDELAAFDLREKGYDRVDITSEVCGIGLDHPVYTYVGPESPATDLDEAVIGSRYERMVLDAAAEFGDAFLEAFKRTTRQSELPRRDGHYQFADPEQNAAAGRDKMKS